MLRNSFAPGAGVRFSRWIALLILGLALAGPPTLAAAPEGEPQLKRLEISLWPEYDDPRLLVIYQGDFSPEASPTEAKFLLPKGAVVTSTCSLEANGTHHPQPSKVADKGDAIEVSFPLPYPSFHLEYYHDAIQGLPQKTIDFRGQLLYPVDDLNLEILQPLRSSNLQTSPPAATTWTDEQGFKHHQVALGKLDAGQPIQVAVSYTKADARPSLEGAQGGLRQPLLWGLGLALLLAAFVYYLFLRRRRVAAPALKGSGKARPRHPGARFCPQCGGQLPNGARFCPQCGRRVGPR